MGVYARARGTAVLWSQGMLSCGSAPGGTLLGPWSSPSTAAKGWGAAFRVSVAAMPPHDGVQRRQETRPPKEAGDAA